MEKHELQVCVTKLLKKIFEPKKDKTDSKVEKLTYKKTWYMNFVFWTVYFHN